jgi:hypothetical protein
MLLIYNVPYGPEPSHEWEMGILKDRTSQYSCFFVAFRAFQDGTIAPQLSILAVWTTKTFWPSGFDKELNACRLGKEELLKFQLGLRKSTHVQKSYQKYLPTSRYYGHHFFGSTHVKAIPRIVY